MPRPGMLIPFGCGAIGCCDEADRRVNIHSIKIGLGFKAKFSENLTNLLHFIASSAFRVEPADKGTHRFCLGLFAFFDQLCSDL